MHTVRLATPHDAATITLQRHLMFQDNDKTSSIPWTGSFESWVHRKLQTGEYIGWLAEDQGNLIAGAGMQIVDFPPHWMHPEPQRAYLLNFYTAPSHRGHGIAKQLLALAVEEARTRGISTLFLHASAFGRPIYENFGFTASNEMLLRIPLKDAH